MGSKLYVGGLPYAATDSQLTSLFAAHGIVESARVITDKFTGQSRGFGFVEMATQEEGKAAITALNGTQMDGRPLTVNEAKPQEPRTGGGGGLGAISASTAAAPPQCRSTWKDRACVPGRNSAGQRASTSVSERPARTAATASAVWSSKRARGGESEVIGAV